MSIDSESDGELQKTSDASELSFAPRFGFRAQGRPDEQGLPEPYKPEQSPQVRAAMSVAQNSGIDSERANRSIALGRKLGLPPRVVVNNLQMARNEEIARKIDANPLLATWIGRDELKAAITARDADRMNELFNGLQKEYERRAAQRNDLNFIQKFGHLLGEGVTDVAENMEASLTGLARYLGKTQITDGDGNIQTIESPLLLDWGSEMDRVREARQNARGPRLEADSVLGGYLQDVVRMAPQIGSQIAASVIGGMIGGPAGAVAGGMSVMGSQIAGGQYDKLRRDGVDNDRAFLAGVADAAMQAPLEQIGVGG